MRARSCIKLAMWLKLIPAKVGKDGKIQLHLLDLRVMAMSILFVVAFSAILSCHNVSKVGISAENICYMVNFVMGFGIFPISYLINGFSVTQVGSLLLTSNVNISGSALISPFMLLFCRKSTSSQKHLPPRLDYSLFNRSFSNKSNSDYYLSVLHIHLLSTSR